MSLTNLLNSFADMLVIIKDEKGNIIYPEEAQMVNYINELQHFKDNEYYHPETKLWYRLDTSSYVEKGEKYSITRFFEISEYKKREHNLQLDETTGIVVKKKVYQEFNDYLMQARENGEDFSAIIADADFFKRVNDTYGHIAGDFVLNFIAQTFVKQTRQTDTKAYPNRPKDLLGRIGGEEFLIVLKNIPAFTTLYRVNQIRASIESTPIKFHDDTINITCSFGAVHVSKDSLRKINPTPSAIDNFRSLVQHEADRQLYNAKESGRNQVKIKAKL